MDSVNPNLKDRIIEGVMLGIDRQWRYAKDLLKIRPEYLLTVSVADRIIQGFDDVSGMDVTLRLEVPTSKLRRDIVLNRVGWNRYFSSHVGPVSRPGWVDIYVQTPAADYVVELKNVDPSPREIGKEVVRLGELLLVNNGDNHCEACHIAFPTLRDELRRIREKVGNKIDRRLSFDVSAPGRVDTGEDPEDGAPVYYPVCITLLRNT